MSNGKAKGKELRPWLKIAERNGGTVECKGRHIKVRNAKGRLVMTLPHAGNTSLGHKGSYILRKRWSEQGWPCP